MRKWIVEVTMSEDPENLDPADVDEFGDCCVDGAYRIHTEGELLQAGDPGNNALALFHEVAPISTLEDYTLLIRPELEEDAGDDWLRADLGIHSAFPDASTPTP